MTTVSRRLGTARLVASAFAVGSTARSSHGRTLAELCNDAASGHPAQRMAFSRAVVSGVWHTYWRPNQVPRFLRVQVLFTSPVTISPTSGGAAVALEIDDGTTTVPVTDPAIPAGLDGSPAYRSGYASSNNTRLGAGNMQTWYLDTDALVTAGLSRTASWWRFEWALTLGTDAEIESLVVDELPRWLVDDAADFGQIPTVYFAGGLIVDGTPNGLQRLYETARVGLVDGVSTYHCLGRPEADAWTITSTSFATFGGSDEETAGVAARYEVRPRQMRPVKPRVRFLVRYQITGASPGDTATVRLTTGDGNHDVTLTTLGSWAESAWTTARLDKTGGLDEITWTAKVSNGASTLRISARVVIDYPEP